jgi:hypothetical protein
MENKKNVEKRKETGDSNILRREHRSLLERAYDCMKRTSQQSSREGKALAILAIIALVCVFICVAKIWSYRIAILGTVVLIPGMCLAYHSSEYRLTIYDSLHPFFTSIRKRTTFSFILGIISIASGVLLFYLDDKDDKTGIASSFIVLGGVLFAIHSMTATNIKKYIAIRKQVSLSYFKEFSQMLSNTLLATNTIIDEMWRQILNEVTEIKKYVTAGNAINTSDEYLLDDVVVHLNWTSNDRCDIRRLNLPMHFGEQCMHQVIEKIRMYAQQQEMFSNYKDIFEAPFLKLEQAISIIDKSLYFVKEEKHLFVEENIAHLSSTQLSVIAMYVHTYFASDLLKKYINDEVIDRIREEYQRHCYLHDCKQEGCKRAFIDDRAS